VEICRFRDAADMLVECCIRVINDADTFDGGLHRSTEITKAIFILTAE